jgi:hypothetical protein
MEFLRDLFGSITSGIIRLAVAVGVLAAAYFFIVKPVLNTTDHAIDTANKSFEQSFGPNSEVNKAVRKANRQVQIQIKRSVHQANRHGNPQKLIKCIQRADGDVNRMQRCTVRFAH